MSDTIMRLEEEIKQKHFTSEIHKLFVNIRYTANWLKGHENKIFKEYGLSPQQFNVLRILQGQHPKAINLNDISCRMLDKDSNTSRLTDKLCRAGLAHREQDAVDRRQVRITITPKGQQLLDDANGKMQQLFATIKLPTEKQMEAVNTALDQLRDN